VNRRVSWFAYSHCPVPDLEIPIGDISVKSNSLHTSTLSSLVRNRVFKFSHSSGPFCASVRLSLILVPLLFRPFPLRSTAPLCRIINLLVNAPLCHVSKSLLTQIDRSAKTIGLTQGPPDFVPLADFERYSFRLVTALICADQRAICDVQLTVSMDHFWRGLLRKSIPFSGSINVTGSKLSMHQQGVYDRLWLFLMFMSLHFPRKDLF
jgi:hypothetical protein